MRRASIAAVVAALPLVAGCSGADALRAEQLLRESSHAQQQLRSETFTGRITVSAEGRDVVVKVSGGGYFRGPRAGDFFVDVDLPATPGLSTQLGSMRVVRRSGVVSMTMGDKTATLPMPRSSPPTVAGRDAASALNLERYIKDVKVEERRKLAGASVAKVTGVLDTSSFVHALATLGALTSATGEQLPDMSNAFGDTRVVAYFSERTHRLLAALVDASVHADAHTLRMHFDLGFQRFNKPVAIPAS